MHTAVGAVHLTIFCCCFLYVLYKRNMRDALKKQMIHGLGPEAGTSAPSRSRRKASTKVVEHFQSLKSKSKRGINSSSATGSGSKYSKQSPVTALSDWERPSLGHIPVRIPRIATLPTPATAWKPGRTYRQAPQAEVLKYGLMWVDPVGIDGHFSVCCGCGKSGDMVMCETCPGVWHPRCASDLNAHGIPDDSWSCPLCYLAHGVAPCTLRMVLTQLERVTPDPIVRTIASNCAAQAAQLHLSPDSPLPSDSPRLQNAPRLPNTTLLRANRSIAWDGQFLPVLDLFPPAHKESTAQAAWLCSHSFEQLWHHAKGIAVASVPYDRIPCVYLGVAKHARASDVRDMSSFVPTLAPGQRVADPDSALALACSAAVQQHVPRPSPVAHTGAGKAKSTKQAAAAAAAPAAGAAAAAQPGAPRWAAYLTPPSFSRFGDTVHIDSFNEPDKAALAANLAIFRTHGALGPWVFNVVPGLGTGIVPTLPPFDTRLPNVPGGQRHAARASAARRARNQLVQLVEAGQVQLAPKVASALRRRAARRGRPASDVLVQQQAMAGPQLEAAAQAAHASAFGKKRKRADAAALDAADIGSAATESTYDYLWRNRIEYGGDMPGAVFAQSDALHFMQLPPRPLSGRQLADQSCVALQLLGCAALHAQAKAPADALDCSDSDLSSVEDGWNSDYDSEDSETWFQLGPNASFHPRWEVVGDRLAFIVVDDERITPPMQEGLLEAAPPAAAAAAATLDNPSSASAGALTPAASATDDDRADGDGERAGEAVAAPDVDVETQIIDFSSVFFL